MKILLERNGGFLGMRQAALIDTDSLAPEDAESLQSMVDSANFFNLPARIADMKQGADRFQYRLSIEASDNHHTIEISEAAVPENLEPLLKRLIDISRANRYNKSNKSGSGGAAIHDR
jgi:hypothetical protein